MKIEKNKVVFAAVLTVILLFLISYSIKVASTKETDINKKIRQPTLPELPDDQTEYKSRLEAVDKIEKIRERNAPSLYPEKYMDSLGIYDSVLPQKAKNALIDSIYQHSAINSDTHRTSTFSIEPDKPANELEAEDKQISGIAEQSHTELALTHQLFFSSSPVHPLTHTDKNNSDIIALVDQQQVIRINSRLRLRLSDSIEIAGRPVPKNTLIYGRVTMQPNRVLIDIETIDGIPVSLSAYDFQDGDKGLYIENNFRQEISRELIDDALGDVNIPNVPQLGTIARLFKRDNRNIKITMLNNYKLLLKP